MFSSPTASHPLANRAECDASAELDCELMQVDSDSEESEGLVEVEVEVATTRSVDSNVSTFSWPDDVDEL